MKKLLIGLVAILFSGCIKIYQDIPDKDKDTIIVYDTIIVEAKDYSVWDFDGNGYTTVTIGNQVWLGENLKTTHYNDGTPISHVIDRIEWGGLAEGAYCWYDKKSISEYGALYNKYSIYTNKLCPVGWHVPTDNDWIELVDYLGGEYLAGGKLKESGIEYWLEPNLDATNESGFSALPAGALFSLNYTWPFLYQNKETYYWTSTIPTDRYNSSTMIQLNYNSSYVNFYKNAYIDNYGLSVRCIKNSI